MSLSDLDPEVGGFGCEPFSAVSLTIELNQEIRVPLNPRKHCASPREWNAFLKQRAFCDYGLLGNFQVPRA